jgi:ABC-type glutathione transport system ATPase component
MKVTDLQKKYHSKLSLFQKNEGGVAALKGVTFAIQAHEVLGLVGETGCGKSTLARLLVGLEKPTSGTITFQGQAIGQLKGITLKNFRKECQLVFQDTLTSLNPVLRIRDILLEPLDNYFQLKRESKIKLIEEMLDLVKLEPRILTLFPGVLSGGERQRVNICRALLLRPKLLICDEIISSLDVMAQAAILNLLQSLQRQLGMSLLFISHDLNTVKYLSRRIMVMYRGEIVEIIDNRQAHYQIQHPYTQQLLESIPVNHPAKR